MNHCVPSFEMEEDGLITTIGSKKSSMAEAKVMELLWQNGEVVTQTQRSPRKSHLGGASAEQREIRSDQETAANHQLFMQEDEMASWLQYPLDDSSFDRDFYADLLGPAAPSAPVATAVPPPPQAVAPLPPMPPQRRVEPSIESPPPQQTYQNFSHFSRLKGRIESGPSSSNKAGKVSTVEDSKETPLTTGLKSRVLWGADNSTLLSGGDIGYSIPAAAANTSPAACELAVSSSPVGSGASEDSAEPMQKLTGATATATEDRKRKAIEIDDGECQSEDVESESAHAKKQAHGSISTKRSRAAEVHNLSERRRRDRINEKMKALQELIPRCNKSDKASMLDEAIEYLKSLQMQVQQMMSMGCGMVPMMFPGVQLSPMVMGMGMGMNRPMVPFSSVLLGSAMQNPAAAVHLAPRFPMPGFHMSSVPPSDPSRMQVTAQSDVMRSSLASQNPNQSRVSNFSPYQQYLGIHQPQVPPLTQNQAVVQPSPSKPNSSREVGNPDNGRSD